MNSNLVDSSLSTADRLALAGHLLTAFSTVLFSMAALMRLVQTEGHVPSSLTVVDADRWREEIPRV